MQLESKERSVYFIQVGQFPYSSLVSLLPFKNIYFFIIYKNTIVRYVTFQCSTDIAGAHKDLKSSYKKDRLINKLLKKISRKHRETEEMNYLGTMPKACSSLCYIIHILCHQLFVPVRIACFLS